MDWEYLFAGIGFLLGGYLMYYYLLKNEKPSSKETNWEGMTGANYIGLWSVVIMCYLGAFVLILRSLPSQI